MNIIQKMAAISALATAPLFGAGCSNSQSPDHYPLEKLRAQIPGIYLFDVDRNDILDEKEAQQYVDAVIINGNKKLTNKEIADKILEVYRQIYDNSSVARIRRGFLDPSYHHSKNIKATLGSFTKIHTKYLNAHYNEQDNVIKAKLPKDHPNAFPISNDRVRWDSLSK